MPVHTHPDPTDPSIIMMKFYPYWKWDELEEAMKQVMSYLDRQNHKIHLILDMQECGLPPHGILARGQDFLNIKHRNFASIIMVADSFNRKLFTLITRMNLPTCKRIRVTASLDDARRLCSAVVDQSG